MDRLDQVRVENKEKILARLMNRAAKELTAKNWSTALKTLEEASQLAPGDASISKKVAELRIKVAEERISVDLARADAAARNKQWQEAEAILTSLQAERPDPKIQAKLEDIHVQKLAAQLLGIKTQASALTRLEKYDEALQAWETYLRHAPDNRAEAEEAIQRIRTISSLARDYVDAQEAIRRKHYGRAIELLQGIIARDPMYKATSRLLAEAVQANRATPFWNRGWVWGILGTLGVAALVVLGITFGPRLWTDISALFQRTPPAGPSQELPSLDSILAYMAENQGFVEDFSGPELRL